MPLMVADQAPEFLDLARNDPEKAHDELVKLVVGNLAFELPRLPALARETLARDHVAQYLKSPEYKMAVDGEAARGQRREAPGQTGELNTEPTGETGGLKYADSVDEPVTKWQRAASQEFDKLLLEHGPENGWITDPAVLVEPMQGGQSDRISITGKLMRQDALEKARKWAARDLGGDPNSIAVPDRAALLPKLKEHLAKQAEEARPQQQADALGEAIQPAEGKQPVPTGELSVGDTLHIEGEKVVVAEVDPDTGNVTLQDGSKFGRNVLPDGSHIYVEGWEPVEARTEDGGPEPTGTPTGKVKAGNFGDFTALLTARGSLDESTLRPVPGKPGYATALWRPPERRAGARGATADEPKAVLLHENKVVGAFGGDTVSINPEHRGQGLSKFLYERRLELGPLSPRTSFSDAGRAARASFMRWKESNPEAISEPRPAELKPDAVPSDTIVGDRGAVVQPAESRSASGNASVGGFVETASKAAGQVFTDSPGLGARDVRPVNHMPELVRMVTDLLGAAPELKKSLGKAIGHFQHTGVKGVIRMRYDQFLHENARELPQLLAHEIGHAVDWLPDKSLKRGNLIGRVRSLRDFLKGSFGELKDKELRQELLGVSQWWRQWDPAKLDDTSRKYFTSGKELYADALSVLLNSPGDLQARAPKFYEGFMRYLDAKPPVKESFLELQTLLARGPEAVAAERLTRKREGYVKGDEELARILREKEAARTSVKGFMLDVQQSHIDRATLVNEAVKKFRKEGKANAEAAATSAREAWEESLFADNRTALDLASIFEHSLHPLQELGLDQHDLGAVIELQRVIGNKDAREQLVGKLEALGRDKYRKAVALAAEWERMLAGAGNDPAKLDIIEGGMRGKADEAGLEFDDITEISKLKLEQGTRAEIANPGGFLPADAEMTLRELLKAKTPAQQGALLSAAAEFRKVIIPRIREAIDAGVYAPGFRKTFEANKDTYAAFRSLDHVDDFVSPAIRRAKGTLKDIENPFYTTILKLRSLNNLIARNAALVEWRNLFLREFPDAWQKAERYHDGTRFHDKAPAKGMERLIVREGGKPVAYDVDPHVAEAFRDPDRLNGMWRVVDAGFRSGIYPLIIKYNPFFQYISNPIRDARRSSRNLGALAGWKAELKLRGALAKRWVAPFAEPLAARSERVRGFLEDWESARNFVKGAPDAIGREMMEVAAIGTPHDSITQLDVRDGFAELMRRYHLAKPEEQGRLRAALSAIPRHIQYAGAIREALPKVATYRILTRDLGWSPRQAATVVRNSIGTPNYKVKGTKGIMDSTMVPFLNIFLQGYRSDMKVALQPKTAGGWWARWAMGDGARAVLAGLAVAGVFGAATKQLYQGVPENDKSNYDVIPLGKELGGDFGSRTVYLRIPRDESSRLLSALTYKLTRALAGDAAGGMAAQDAFKVGEGSVPGINPIFQVASAWKDYLGGQNPVDPFRNRPVIPETEFAAGGAHALKPMLSWTLDKTGLLSFVAYNRDAKTTAEMYTDAGKSVRSLAQGEGGAGEAIKVAEALPGLTKLLKTSDYGYVERQREEGRQETQGKALVRVEYAPEVRGLINEYQTLSRTGQRTEEQELRYAKLKAWHREFVRYDEALQKMNQDPASKAEVKPLQQQFNTFSQGFLDENLQRVRGAFKALGKP